MKTISHRKTLIITFLILTLMGIFLPGLLLHIVFSSDLNSVKQVSDDKYNTANSIIAQNASAKLSRYEKIKLISGTWDSEQTEADASLSTITEIEAVEEARKAVSRLYQKKCYPYHFDSAYGNWYSWETHFYQCTETSFHTYSACYWQISFLHYSTEERHDILMTEDGTVLAIRNNQPAETAAQLPENWPHHMQSYFQELYGAERAVSFFQKTRPEAIAAYPNIQFHPTDILADNILVLNHSEITSENELKTMFSSLPEETEIYEICSYTNPHYFLMTVTPWE